MFVEREWVEIEGREREDEEGRERHEEFRKTAKGKCSRLFLPLLCCPTKHSVAKHRDIRLSMLPTLTIAI